MSQDKRDTSNPPERGGALQRVTELARQVLSEAGLSDEQIVVLLKRRRVRDLDPPPRP